MSFICDNCGKVQRNKKSPIKVMLDYRKKIYPERRDENDIVIDKGGNGWEIVKEANFCVPCYRASLKEDE